MVKKRVKMNTTFLFKWYGFSYESHRIASVTFGRYVQHRDLVNGKLFLHPVTSMTYFLPPVSITLTYFLTNSFAIKTTRYLTTSL